ncbi:hypothetical protein LEP1GSC047_3271 [Leptospira inadai serovar Lyme str. 10]|uniref:Uncharacterized protein n=1 Tax=Leptospira inadai serovar Lyme str. 10 TaxID=1049790 RepID=V6HBC8_9LEPT|nr:hypothetical protein LEP1GSC047_3271 [Leptospira inadai serovar Lyme str. 10]
MHKNEEFPNSPFRFPPGSILTSEWDGLCPKNASERREEGINFARNFDNHLNSVTDWTVLYHLLVDFT